MAVEFNSIFLHKNIQRKERNENTKHLPATFALKRMLIQYNFRVARDPEMLHNFYNAGPVAPFIEIPRHVDIIKFEKHFLNSNTDTQSYIVLKMVKMVRVSYSGVVGSRACY